MAKTNQYLLINRSRRADKIVSVGKTPEGQVNSVQIMPRGRRYLTLTETQAKNVQAQVEKDSELELQDTRGVN